MITMDAANEAFKIGLAARREFHIALLENEKMLKSINFPIDGRVKKAKL
jgi:hypothetical protein